MASPVHAIKAPVNEFGGGLDVGAAHREAAACVAQRGLGAVKALEAWAAAWHEGYGQRGHQAAAFGEVVRYACNPDNVPKPGFAMWPFTNLEIHE